MYGSEGTPLHQTPYFSFRQQLFCVLFFSLFLNPTILYHIAHTFGPAQKVSLYFLGLFCPILCIFTVLVVGKPTSAGRKTLFLLLFCGQFHFERRWISAPMGLKQNDRFKIHIFVKLEKAATIKISSPWAQVGFPTTWLVFHPLQFRPDKIGGIPTICNY